MGNRNSTYQLYDDGFKVIYDQGVPHDPRFSKPKIFLNHTITVFLKHIDRLGTANGKFFTMRRNRTHSICTIVKEEAEYLVIFETEQLKVDWMRQYSNICPVHCYRFKIDNTRVPQVFRNKYIYLTPMVPRQHPFTNPTTARERIRQKLKFYYLAYEP